MTRNAWIPLIVLSILLLTAPVGQAKPTGDVLYAKPSATGTGSCDSWANACTLQTALGKATSGDEIWVAQGIYKPTTGTERSATFQLVSDVGVYGGFAGTETSRNQRDWKVRESILSGDIGVVADKYDNSYHVVTGSDSAHLDGFTVAAGHANGSYPHDYGGGMYNSESSSPTLTNTTFSGNSATHGGGGMFNYASSSPTLTNCTFEGNSATRGGGMYNSESSSPTLTNTTFSGNSATRAGGMYNDSSSPTLTNCTFEGNSATSIGGGMYNWPLSSPTLTNCTFSGNSASIGGGMFNYASSSPTLTNCTFSGNSATLGGGMFNYASSSPTLANCILWGDSPEEMFNEGSNSPAVTYSDIQGGYVGVGNIDTDPLFVDADGPDGVAGTADDDLRLKSGSPAIDAGSNTYNSTTSDLAGNPRIVDGNGDGTAVIDMGAYERQTGSCSPPGIPVLLSPPDGTSTTDWMPTFAWLSVPGATDYRIRLVEAATGTEVLSKKTSQTQYTPDTPLQPMAYFWRVRAYNGCGDGDWSERSALTILPTNLDYGAYLPLVTRGTQ